MFPPSIHDTPDGRPIVGRATARVSAGERQRKEPAGEQAFTREASTARSACARAAKVTGVRFRDAFPASEQIAPVIA
jgi:hypothetical protein